MNPYPFQVPIIGQNEYYYILKELNELKKKVAYLEEEINKKDESNYLKKDDNYYMI